MDQRQANREAKRAALFLLPVDPPMPTGLESNGVERSDADRLRDGWRRMRRQLERDSDAPDAPAVVDDPDQIAAWSLADLRGPLCTDHDAPVAQVTWARQATPRWERMRFACGCEREAPATSAWGPDAAPGECCAGQRLGGEHYPDCPIVLGPR